MHQDSPRNLVTSLLRTQALLTVIAVVPAFFFAGPQAALGVAMGGGVGLLLSAVFALRAFALPAGATAQQIVMAMYRAAATKMLVAVVLFVLVARFATALFGPVMIGYIVTLVAYWIAGVRFARSHNPRS